MTLNTYMPDALRPFYQSELTQYRAQFAQGHWAHAWTHLERAHVIGQAYPVTHSQVHWLMLVFGVKIKSLREVIGQIPRLLVGGVKSFVGHIPVGNTGGANVPPLRPLPIAADIQDMFAQAGIHRNHNT
ncbi:hypothetical protein BFP72_07760 [Reichenbachiella sp. 5M10]|uniref:DUF3703 domain-containing protein n=1 Tax=Reichenbachiella sp. 5M10 TaxID=1889772 RepID=UPI000C151427|nr:DUF3703 domain-containing protein [Reichenbachiella sp. 5M10]PIB35300.1 hypothetical protein BFP72_07760 [Reichenbachiella sp. 5M10]